GDRPPPHRVAVDEPRTAHRAAGDRLDRRGHRLPPVDHPGVPTAGPAHAPRVSTARYSVAMTLPTPAESDALLPQLQQIRRSLHRNPEVGLDLPLTQRTVLDALDGLDLEVTTGDGLSSVVAVLRGGRREETEAGVLLRGDMDALPIEEETGFDFASDNGAMHACG